MTDEYDLQRFVSAQDSGDTFSRALNELHSGRKQSHWMWFIFPQIAGLGRSSTAKLFAIGSLAEATAYLAHPVLGLRLIECTEALLSLDRSAEDIFGSIDAMKLKSSMTLFRAASESTVFEQVLTQYFGGEADVATERLLA